MDVTDYIKLFRMGGDRYNVILMSLLFQVPDAKSHYSNIVTIIESVSVKFIFSEVTGSLKFF